MKWIKKLLNSRVTKAIYTTLLFIIGIKLFLYPGETSLFFIKITGLFWVIEAIYGYFKD